MKVGQAIELAKSIKPNGYTDDVLLRWLNECEGKIQTEIHKILPEDVTIYHLPDDHEQEMLVPFPYDELYWQYLAAKIDFQNGEYTKYQNSREAYKKSEKTYHAWYLRHRHTCWQDCGGK